MHLVKRDYLPLHEDTCRNSYDDTGCMSNMVEMLRHKGDARRYRGCRKAGRGWGVGVMPALSLVSLLLFVLACRGRRLK